MKLQNKSKYKNKKRFSSVCAVRVLSLAGSHGPLHLPRMPFNTALVSGPAVGPAQTLIWPCCCMFLPPMSTAVSTSVFSFVGELHAFLYIPLTQSLPRWSCGSNPELVQLVRRFWGSHTAPGFRVWFYLPLCMWVVHWGLFLRLPWRTWVFPSEARVWRWCGCMGWCGPGSTRCSGGLAARVAGNTVLQKGVATHPCILARRIPLTEKSWRPQSIGHRVGHNQSNPACLDARIFVFASGSSAPNTDY